MGEALSESCKCAAPDLASEPVRVELATGDMDEFTASDLHWETNYYQAEHGVLQASLRLSQAQSSQVGETRFSTGVMVRGGVPPGTVVFGVLSAHEQLYLGRSVKADDVVLARDQDEIEYGCKGPSLLCTVAVEEALLAREVEARWGTSLEELSGSRTLALADGRQRAALQRELIPLLTGEGGSQDERVLELLFRYLRPPAEPPESLPHRQRLARAAEEYLRSHLSEPLSMGALCRRTGARERTLFLGFRERYGMSPQAYLKLLRLDAARRALASAEPGTRVTDIAMWVGFTHLGRFSNEYGAHFGEAPSTTLARSLGRTRP